MNKISIISSSVRDGRKSNNVALYFKNYIHENKLAEAEILDLKEFNFPLFEERLKFQKNPSKQLLDFTNTIVSSDGILIVTPEYNGGIPASLKNVIDVLYDEWHHQPIALCTASAGAFGGSQVVMSLQFTLWKMHVITVPEIFHVPTVHNSFDELGNPIDKVGTDKRASIFIKELLWFIEAKKQMKNREV